jgi:hypothetical protein
MFATYNKMYRDITSYNNEFILIYVILCNGICYRSVMEQISISIYLKVSVFSLIPSMSVVFRKPTLFQCSLGRSHKTDKFDCMYIHMIP